jgi:hypothetical protein
MKLKNKKTFVVTVIFLLIVGGLFWYNQDLKFRIADMRLCKNDISFLHHYRELNKGCYDESYSYGKYHNIKFSRIKRETIDSILNNSKQNNVDFDDRFKYVFDKYTIEVFVKSKVGDGNVLIGESYGDLVYAKIYNNNNNTTDNYRIVISLSNPAKFTTNHQAVYKKVKTEDIKKIVNLIIKK